MSKYEFTEKEDGRIVVMPKERPQGSQYGSWLQLPLNPSDEDIKTAKEHFVNEICDTIRQLAERDDFFIRKDFPNGNDFLPDSEPYTSLAWKIIFPTLTDN